jgi:hypothetical protein
MNDDFHEKFATGSGAAKKDKMIESAKNAFKVKIIDDNQADALWLLALASKEYSRIDIRANKVEHNAADTVSPKAKKRSGS